jgi:hypothetical protein
METSEIATSLQAALTEAAKAHKDLEAAKLKLAPLEQAAEEKDDIVNDLMNQYRRQTGGSIVGPPPPSRKRGGIPGSKRPARSLEAILMTTASRVAKAAQKDGKKKAEGAKAVMESCQKIAVKRAESISPELQGKIEGRIGEIFGKK